MTDDTRRAETRRRFSREGVRRAVVVLVGVYVALFIGFNQRTVKISFVFGSTRASLIWLILLALAAGLVLGALGSRLRLRRRR